MTQRTTAKAWMKPILSLLALAVVLSLVAEVTSPSFAEALTVTSTTARSNQESGYEVVGGVPTRILWEADVDEGEQVKSITLKFPEGSFIADDANVLATILYQEDPKETPKRIEVDQVYTISDAGFTIAFAELIPEAHTIRIEINGIALPPEGGAYVLTGSYVDGTGTTRKLEDPISIVVIDRPLIEKVFEWLGEQKWVQVWNTQFFLRLFLNPQYAIVSIPNLFFGWLRSLGLVAVGFPLAIPIGLAFAFLRMAKLRIVRFIASIYVNVIRGTPLFLQMYIVIMGLKMVWPSLDSYMLGIVVLALNSSAYLAEIFRAGIQSIHKGQFEASASLGMNGAMTMFFVIIPQTVRRVIPTATSEFILLFKDTSLLAAVGVMEMMMFAKSMVAGASNMTPYVVAAGFYLIVTLPLTKFVGIFEKKLAASEGTISQPLPKKKKPGLLGGLATVLPIPTMEGADAVIRDAESVDAADAEYSATVIVEPIDADTSSSADPDPTEPPDIDASRTQVGGGKND
ncbi:MAG: amino acid ABC transporter permease [Coriobacteriia bacterium]|nr:amino acid ABC transporter permease [Coriobacteriia bacterium]